MAEITCIVVTPERTVLEETVEFLVLPLFDGELGVGHNHTPLIGRLGFGELRLGRKPTSRRFYVDGGFVEVLGNVVSVLTNRCVPSGEIDVEAAREQLESARTRPATSEEMLELRDRHVRQARAQLRVARRATVA